MIDRVFETTADFYEQYPHLADGYGVSAFSFDPRYPFGSDELPLLDRVGKQWMITLAAPKRVFSYPESYRREPGHARGAVVARRTPPPITVVLVDDVDLHAPLGLIYQEPRLTVEQLMAGLRGVDESEIRLP